MLSGWVHVMLSAQLRSIPYIDMFAYVGSALSAARTPACMYACFGHLENVLDPRYLEYISAGDGHAFLGL